MFQAQRVERALPTPLHEPCDPRIRLKNEYETIAVVREMSDCLADSIAAKGAPIKIVDALLERLLDGRCGHTVAGANAEAAHAQAGTAQSGVVRNCGPPCARATHSTDDR